MIGFWVNVMTRRFPDTSLTATSALLASPVEVLMSHSFLCVHPSALPTLSVSPPFPSNSIIILTRLQMLRVDVYTASLSPSSPSKEPSQQRVKKWGFSLEEALKDPAGQELFLKFLESEFSSENLR